MTQPLVSIIVPAYNSADYISAALDSCLTQTYEPIEVIVVDDGSTDDTKTKLQPLVESGKIRYVHQKNQGLSAARNTGIKNAQGKYLQFLDSDDLLLPEKIEKQVASLESASISSVAGCDFRFFNGSDVTALYGGDRLHGKFPLQLVERLFEFETVIHRWLFPASLVREIRGFEEDMPATEDWLMVWKLAAKGTQFSYTDEPLALYRKHSQTMTNDFERIAKGHLIAIDHVEKYQKEVDIDLYSKTELDRLRESYHYELGLHLIRANQTRRAWSQLIKAFFLSSNRRQVKLLLVATVPALGSRSIEWVTSANDRLWRWRAHLRKTFVG